MVTIFLQKVSYFLCMYHHMISYWCMHLRILHEHHVLVTGYGLDDQGVGVRVPVGARIFSSPCYPDRLQGPPSLLSNVYRGLFPRGQSGRDVKLTTHLQLVCQGQENVGVYIHCPIRLHGILLNWLSTGTTLSYHVLVAKNSDVMFLQSLAFIVNCLGIC
jgi:hypothetical protein